MYYNNIEISIKNERVVYMSKIYKNVSELVGRTPLIEVERFSKAMDA